MMATGDYNSPYTGAQLDDTIRKISSNDIHTYVEVFSNPAGTSGITGIALSSLPAGPNGLRTGVYDVEFNTQGGSNTAMDGASLSRLIIHDTNTNASGSGHTGMWTDNVGAVRAQYDAGDGRIKILHRIINVQTGAAVDDSGSTEIYYISRQDTVV